LTLFPSSDPCLSLCCRRPLFVASSSRTSSDRIRNLYIPGYDVHPVHYNTKTGRVYCSVLQYCQWTFFYQPWLYAFIPLAGNVY
jgi:hypothetical protein